MTIPASVRATLDELTRQASVAVAGPDPWRRTLASLLVDVVSEVYLDRLPSGDAPPDVSEPHTQGLALQPCSYAPLGYSLNFSRDESRWTWRHTATHAQGDPWAHRADAANDAARDMRERLTQDLKTRTADLGEVMDCDPGEGPHTWGDLLAELRLRLGGGDVPHESTADLGYSEQQPDIIARLARDGPGSVVRELLRVHGRETVASWARTAWAPGADDWPREASEGSAPPDQDTADVLTAWTWLRAQPANDGSGVDLRVGADGRVRTHCELAPRRVLKGYREGPGERVFSQLPSFLRQAICRPQARATVSRILRLATYEKVWPIEIEDSIQLLAARYPVTADTVIEVIEEHGLAGAPTQIEAMIRG